MAPEHTRTENAVAALVGYVLGAFVVVPFDRLKTVLQVTPGEGKHLRATVLARTVFRTRGLAGLYQGMGAHMLIAPYTMFYYAVYGELLQKGGGSPYAPFGAALCARTMEVTVRMPLELVRTQIQASDRSLTLVECLRAQRSQPWAAWLRGYVPTLLRDVPFSAIYWFAYERAMVGVRIPERWVSSPALQTVTQAYVCGAGAGMVAALATTPQDVIKTMRQHHMEASKVPSYSGILGLIWRQPRIAFVGVGPRLVRIPLGLATMMSGIEVTKWAFDRRRLRLQEAETSTATATTACAASAS